MSPHKGEFARCGDSRHDLNYPEIPDSWNNKENTTMANFNARRKEMGNPMFLAGKEVESVEDVLGEWNGVELRGGWMNT